jgi:nucleotide-binding universal stress UspA family protein
MTQTERDPVLVGIDGGDSSYQALDWACAHAAALRVGIRLVHAFVWPQLRVRTGQTSSAPGLRYAAEKLLAEAEVRARAQGCRDVESLLVDGFVTAVLTNASRAARMLVLGGRGMTQTLGLLVGSTAYDLTSLASCPVVVLRPGGLESLHTDHVGTRAVVAGYDGSVPAERAVAFAAETAAARGWGLHIVLVHPPGPADTRQDMIHHGLMELVLGWREDWPNVVIDHEVRRAHSASAALIDASRHAELVVVGSRGAGGFVGLLLGSTSRAVLAHATRPVAVVPLR